MSKKLISDETYIGVILSLIATAINLLAGLVLVPALLKHFGQSEYGLYQLIGSLVSNLCILDLGFSVTTTRYISRYNYEKNQLEINRFLSTVFVIYIALAMATMIIGIIIYNNVDAIFSDSLSAEELIKAKEMIFVLIFSIVLSIFGQMFIGILTGFQKYIFQKSALIVKGLSTLFLSLLLIARGADSVSLTKLNAVINIFYYIFTALYVFKKCSFRLQLTLFEKKIMLQASAFAFFVFCQMAMAELYFKSGQLLLGIMTDTSTTAIYSIAITIYNVFYSFTAAISTVVLPKASQFAAGTSDGHKVTCFIIRPSRIITAFYLLMVVGFICCGKQFVFMWSGHNFEAAYYIVVILSIASIVPRALSPAIDIARAYNEHRILTSILAGTGVIIVFLSIIFIKLFGVLGTAAATGIALILCNSAGVSFYIKRKFNIDLIQLYKGVFSGIWIAASVSLLFGVLLNIALDRYSLSVLVLKGFLIICVFLITIYFFGLNKEEKYLLSCLKHKYFGGKINV
ncbi:O-antigen/teichoic acid export membrane protein [Ruminiclostridium sufflavum DSM 19573]|uniref:O-antigen/teichoic acid export membrane protein n=1 Tax=Ruminiclostridium sufflavum DSM 19573 TaxID=1121337 RepID=A0A318XML0_9FIRM|nr:oligosaccharide flippase family protein [Ruminiclostridium sufflavum]PYG87799.1 O-antigen/teichoic acid export membrane protein [Ruminiclostridium sufflavum DSM 19573]